MAETFPYWQAQGEFERQSALLNALAAAQSAGFSGGDSVVSLETLTDQQLERRIGCVYLSGSRIDNAQCLGSRNVGLLHAAYPTDYPKAISPAYHTDHDELITGTCGIVLIEYATSLEPDAEVRETRLSPGDWLLLHRGWPHRVSLAPLRELTRPVTEEALPRVRASYLALKMGRLTGKNALENMSSWSDRKHPLIENWKSDLAFLKSLDEQEKMRLRIP